MGSPDFSVPILDALMAAGHEIVCVYSQPPRPAGRGHKEKPCAVHAFALENGLDVLTPPSLKSPDEQAAFASLKADAAVVAAYGLLLPKAVIEAPPMGCLNVHASLLPRWRGAAPIERAILAGDTETGVSIMVIDEGLDTGDILLTGKVPITATTTASSLHDELSRLGARLMVEALAGLAAGSCVPEPQAGDGVTYADKLTRAEGRLDWKRAAVDLDRRVRALNPRPGVWFEHDGERIKVLAATLEEGKDGKAPGVLIDDKLAVACGEGVLRLARVQRAGKAGQDANAFVLGYPLKAGTRLD